MLGVSLKAVLKIEHGGRKLQLRNPFIDHQRPNAYRTLKIFLRSVGFERVTDEIKGRPVDYVVKGVRYSTIVNDNFVVASAPTRDLLNVAPFLEGVPICFFYGCDKGHKYFHYSRDHIPQERIGQVLPFLDKLHRIYIEALMLNPTEAEIKEQVERKIFGGTPIKVLVKPEPIIKERPLEEELETPVVYESKPNLQIPHKVLTRKVAPSYEEGQKCGRSRLFPKLNLRASQMRKAIAKSEKSEYKSLFEQAWAKTRSRGEQEELATAFYLLVKGLEGANEKEAYNLAKRIIDR